MNLRPLFMVLVQCVHSWFPWQPEKGDESPGNVLTLVINRQW